jgi:glucosamine kinase
MILIADSGSTKTDWALLGAETILFQSSGLNPFYQSSEAIGEVLSTQVAPFVPAAAIQKIYFYGAGCADEATGRPVNEALRAVFPGAEHVDINSDLLAAARSLCGNQAGIACILGTGSNNCLYDGQQIVHNIGSLGFWLGDEGSGGYLGKQLVIKYLHNDLPDDLQATFSRAYPEVSRLMVLDHAYKQPFPNRFFAGFTPFLSQHLHHPAIQQLVTSSFDHFLDTYVIKHQNAYTVPVHFTGSVAHYFDSLLRKALVTKGLRPGKIERSPMPGLLLYHQPTTS